MCPTLSLLTHVVCMSVRDVIRHCTYILKTHTHTHTHTQMPGEFKVDRGQITEKIVSLCYISNLTLIR